MKRFDFLKPVCVTLFCTAAAIAAGAQTLTTLVNFNESIGTNPTAPVVQGPDGNFYGTTISFGPNNGDGTVYKITPSGSLTTLHSFCRVGGCPDGASPTGGLVVGSDGNFYGTTLDGGGGAFDVGTVFKITPSGVLTTIYSFCSQPSCADGESPQAGLVEGTDGNFYGTTSYDGVHGAGTIYKITPSGHFTTLYAFCTQHLCPDGSSPYGGLIQGTDGNFYGTTRGGGSSGFGTVFKITSSGTLTTLHSFLGTDGVTPLSSMLQGTDGNYYGTTSSGGTLDSGTIFKITPNGTFSTFYFFCSVFPGCTDGQTPVGSLMQASDGNFYGTTQNGGGTSREGTVFQITPGGVLTTLYSFNGPDGAQPVAGLAQSTDGSFYGTTLTGGSDNNGTLFRIGVPLSPPAAQLLPITPCRLVDTRQTGGAIPGGTFRVFDLIQLSQSNGCGDLSSATTYSLNVTLIPPSGHPVSYLTIWPAGRTQPLVSTMNSLDGRTKANAAIVPAGAGGAVSVFVTNTANVVLDIDGYFAPPTAQTLQFYPLTPCRVADTRKNTFPPGLGPPQLSQGVARDFPVLSSPCIPQNVNAAAYSFNVTAIPYPSLGYALAYLEVWPTGQQPQHPVSTLNNPTATYVANAAIVPAGTDGEITALASDDTDLAIDVDGYFAPPGAGGLSLYPTVPCRVFDTRKVGSGQPFSGTLTTPVDVVDSACGIPGAAQGYVFNTTVVPSPNLSYLTLWPNGEDQPVVSTLNAADGWITSNMAIVPNVNGKIDAYAAGTTQLILDISSYFAP